MYAPQASTISKKVSRKSLKPPVSTTEIPARETMSLSCSSETRVAIPKNRTANSSTTEPTKITTFRSSVVLVFAGWGLRDIARVPFNVSRAWRPVPDARGGKRINADWEPQQAQHAVAHSNVQAAGGKLHEPLLPADVGRYEPFARKCSGNQHAGQGERRGD